MVAGKMVPEKNGPRKKWSPENWSPEKRPSKIIFRQKNARNYKRLSFSSTDSTTHTKRCLTFTSWSYICTKLYRTLKDSGKICSRVLGFHRLITSEHSTHTPRCSTRTPRFFVSVFRVCFRVLGLLSSFGFS